MNTFSWAQEEELFSTGMENQSFSSSPAVNKLAPLVRMTKPEFKAMYQLGCTLLAHKAVNKVIGDYIYKYFDVSEGTKIDISKLPQYRTEIINGIEVPIVGIPPLLKKTGQIGHVGLGKWNDRLVIYVDSKYFYVENDALKHDREEVAKWEAKKMELEGSLQNPIGYKELRSVIKETGKAKEWRDDFHNSSTDLAILYAEAQEKDPDLIDLDKIYDLYHEYGLDEEDDDFNIAANGGKGPSEEIKANIASGAHELIPLVDREKRAHLPIRVGVHAKRFSDITEAEKLPVNMIELKPGHFPREEKLYYWDNDRNDFVESEANLRKLAAFARRKDAVVQVHFPSWFHAADGKTMRWSIGSKEEHERLIKYIGFLEKIRKKYNLADELIVTIHPPYELFQQHFQELLEEKGLEGIRNHKEIPSLVKKEIEKAALVNGNTFLREAGRIIHQRGWKIKIGVENQMSSTDDYWALGDKIEHFDILLKDTPESIQLTFDTGHRILSEESLNFRAFATMALRHGKHIVDLHFHENEGWRDDQARATYKADLHNFPTSKWIRGFHLHLERVAREKVPLTLEIGINRFSGKELHQLIQNLRRDIDEAEVIEQTIQLTDELLTELAEDDPLRIYVEKIKASLISDTGIFSDVIKKIGLLGIIMKEDEKLYFGINMEAWSRRLKVAETDPTARILLKAALYKEASTWHFKEMKYAERVSIVNKIRERYGRVDEYITNGELTFDQCITHPETIHLARIHFSMYIHGEYLGYLDELRYLQQNLPPAPFDRKDASDLFGEECERYIALIFGGQTRIQHFVGLIRGAGLPKEKALEITFKILIAGVCFQKKEGWKEVARILALSMYAIHSYEINNKTGIMDEDGVSGQILTSDGSFKSDFLPFLYDPAFYDPEKIKLEAPSDELPAGSPADKVIDKKIRDILRGDVGNSKDSPADCLEAIKINDNLLEKALSAKGVTAAVFNGHAELLESLGMLVQTKQKNCYSFSDMMIGPDLNYTKTIINSLIGEVKELQYSNMPKDKQPVVKELIRMTVLNQINLMQKPIVPEKKILWHILEHSILSPSQQSSSFIQTINNASRKSQASERIWLLRRGESINQAIARIQKICPNAVFDVALSNSDHIARVPILKGENKIKMLVFEGSVGDFSQLKGIVAALRALHLEKDMVIPTLLQIYAVMNGASYEGIIPPISMLASPRDFARKFIINLPPATSLPVDDIPKINEKLLKLLVAA